MTLIITALGLSEIYQSADFRLTDARSGKLVTDSSNKLTVLQFESWHGFVSYTGVGSVGGTSTSHFVRTWLAGFNATTPEAVAERLRAKGTLWLQSLGRRGSPGLPHTFVLAAFDAGGSRIFLVSNFERLGTSGHRPISASLETSSYRQGSKPTVIVCGAKKSVSRTRRRQIANLCSRPVDPSAIRRLLARVNAEASLNPAAAGTVSNNCSVVSFRADGSGQMDPGGAAEIQSISSGVPMPTSAEFAKLIGASTLGGLVASGFGSSKPRHTFPPCEPRIVRPQDTEFRLFEVRHPRLASLRALDVNHAGFVLGNGSTDDATPRLWVKPPSPPEHAAEFPIVTSAFQVGYGGINNRNVVAGSAAMADGSTHACVWANEAPIDLGTHKGLDSGAVAISDNGVVVGWVGIDLADRTQKTHRPAAWRGSEMAVLEDFGCDWGAAVDVNAEGWVLVYGYRGFEVRSLLWHPHDHRLHVVGGAAGVYPTRLNAGATVIGNARGPDRHTSFICKLGGSWAPLMTEPGTHANGLNDHGDTVGTALRDGYDKPWMRRASGEVIWLPYIGEHWSRPRAINNSRMAVGFAEADHGSHAMLWVPPPS